MSTLKIGQVAARAGVSVDTVRYYERVGILPKPARRQSGYRQFDPSAIARIQLVKQLQDLSLSLDDIVGMLDAVETIAGTTCKEQSARIEIALARTEEKIRGLQAIKRRLRTALGHCNSGHCNLVERVRAASRKS